MDYVVCVCMVYVVRVVWSVCHVYGVCTHIVCVYVWGLVLTLTVSRHCAVT